MRSILFFFFICSKIFSFELVLQDGSGFICDLLSESDKSYKVFYKDKEYIIPKSEVRTVDYNKKGKHSSFSYSNFVLKDGSKIYGVIAEETNSNFTIKTELGFLSVDKIKIAELPERKNPPDLNSIYLGTNIRLPETRVGIFGSSYSQSAPVQERNPNANGGGFYIEPAFLTWKVFRFGYRGEYLYSIGKSSLFDSGSRIQIFSNFGYIQYNKQFFEKSWLDFQFSFGLGASSVSYKNNSETFAGVNPVGFFEIAWSPIKIGASFIRISSSQFCIQEPSLTLCAVGGNMGMGVRF